MDTYVSREYTRVTKVLTLVVCVLLAGVTGVWAGEQDQHANNEEAVSPEVQALLERTGAGERVRVIIQLAVPFTPERELSAVAMVRQRYSIAQAQEELLDQLKSQDVRSIRRFRTMPGMALSVGHETLKELLEHPLVEAIQEDELLIPFNGGTFTPFLDDSVPLIGVEDVWDQGVTGEGYAVVIIDTGVQHDHPFFQDRIVAGACFNTTFEAQGASSNCPNGEDEMIGAAEAGADCDLEIFGCGHGTHVAGIASGRDVGGSFTGVAKDAKIISINAFSRFSSDSDTCRAQNVEEGQDCVSAFGSDLVAGLEHVMEFLDEDYVVSNINMSLGGGRFFSEESCDDHPANQLRKSVIDGLRAEGVATIAASGNAGFTDSMGSPACISTVVSVGSTTKNDDVSGFSNSADFLDLLAPGSAITAAFPESTTDELFGTSMATPHVAGAWLLVQQANPGWSVDGILDAFIDTGEPITDTPTNQRPGATNQVTPRIQVDQAAGASVPKPTIDITTPQDGVEVNDPEVTVEGSVTNASSVSFRLNEGDAVEVDLDNDSFEVTIEDLQEGENTVDFTATGPGGEADATLTVLFEPDDETDPDPEPEPTIEITDPEDGFVVDEPEVTVQGEVANTTDLSYRLNNGDAVDVNLDNDSFSTTVDDLVQGMNTIEFTAEGPGGSAEATLMVEFDPDVEPAPTIEITSPDDETIVSVPEVEVTGEVTNTEELTYQRNDDDAVNVDLDNGSFAVTVEDLEEGENTIVLTASGPGGTVEASLSVVYDAEVGVDPEPTVVSITASSLGDVSPEPGEPQIVLDFMIEVTGPSSVEIDRLTLGAEDFEVSDEDMSLELSDIATFALFETFEIETETTFEDGKVVMMLDEPIMLDPDDSITLSVVGYMASEVSESRLPALFLAGLLPLGLLAFVLRRRHGVAVFVLVLSLAIGLAACNGEAEPSPPPQPVDVSFIVQLEDMDVSAEQGDVSVEGLPAQGARVSIRY